jgi:hypothetical protein
MTPAEFEQEAAFLAELEDHLKANGDSEGLLLAIKAHAQLQLMIDSDDDPAAQAEQRDELRALVKELQGLTIEQQEEIGRLRAALEKIEAGYGQRLSAAELASMARQAL